MILSLYTVFYKQSEWDGMPHSVDILFAYVPKIKPEGYTLYTGQLK